MFNLIPTEPLEYQIYADYLEDQGVILTAAIRKGILPFDIESFSDHGWGAGCNLCGLTKDVLWEFFGKDGSGWAPPGIGDGRGYGGHDYYTWGGVINTDTSEYFQSYSQDCVMEM